MRVVDPMLITHNMRLYTSQVVRRRASFGADEVVEVEVTGAGEKNDAGQICWDNVCCG